MLTDASFDFKNVLVNVEMSIKINNSSVFLSSFMFTNVSK